MKSKQHGRQDRRPPSRPLKPEERAGLHRVALEYRAALRMAAAVVPPDQVKAEADGDADRRARFAAALARAEFGRFYWKADAGRHKSPRNKRPRPNGARPG